MTKQEISESQIRDAAYFLWLKDGQPAGRDHEHWLKAAEMLNQKPAKANPAKKAVAKKATAKTAKASAKTKTTPAANKTAARKKAKVAKS